MNIPVDYQPSNHVATIQPHIDGGIVQYTMEWKEANEEFDDLFLSNNSLYSKLSELQDRLYEQNALIDETLRLVDQLLQSQEQW